MDKGRLGPGTGFSGTKKAPMWEPLFVWCREEDLNLHDHKATST
jgi:hypothetical protein